MNIENSKWFKFFDAILLDSKNFRSLDPIKRNDFYVVSYDDQTTRTIIKIEIYYVENDSDLLFTVQVLNPKTQGLNKYEENEYFYRHQFDDGNQSEPPGL